MNQTTYIFSEPNTLAKVSESMFTIKHQTTGEYKEKGSKFLAFAFSVKSEEEVKSELEELRKTYYDARHHCYAYILGTSDQSTRANDDGEPNHSAGDPILGQIKSFELTNCLVVVVRYFGGTKLGVGGLISAYKEASAHTLSKAEKIRIIETTHQSIEFPYDQMGTIEKWMEDYSCTSIIRNYTTECSVSFDVEIGNWPEFQNKIQENHLVRLIPDNE